MGNFYKDNDDLRFYIEKYIDWEPIVDLTEYQGRAKGGHDSLKDAVEFYGDILDLMGQFTADEIAPHAEQIDREKVSLVDGEVVFPKRLQGIFDQLKDLEVHGMCLPRELGGQNCPLVVYLLSLELMARGDVSVCAHHGFHGGMAMAMLVYSMQEGTTKFSLDKAEISETRFAEYIEEIRTGKSWGAMDITEPDAGSDMARLRAVGEEDEDGNWFVTGQKIFITSGHGKFHFVIARTEKAADPDDAFAGLAGLSMFLVPTYEDLPDGTRKRIVSIDRVEEKLGHNGSATCSLSFERAPAHLIGKRGEGFRYMLLLMNNARLGVAYESLGLMESAYRMAREYTAERPSMGKNIDKHEMIADYLEEMETDIYGIRALAMHGTVNEEIAQKLQIALDHGLAPGREAELKAAKRRARRATPLLKYAASEAAVAFARQAIQLHGGNGYTKDYGAEKLLRDAMVFPIYEGTSQIQALMAMKDTLGGIIKNPRRFVRKTAQARWRSLSARDPLERRVAKLQSVSLQVQQNLITRTAADKGRSLAGLPVTEWPERFLKNWDPKRDFSYAMLHAERLTRILIDEHIAEVLWAQARRFPERRVILERYLERAEPRCRYEMDRIMTTGESLLSRLNGDSDASNEAMAG